MNRRGFLSALVGVVVAPFVPVRSAVAPIIVGNRLIYARVRITPEMMAMQGAWNRARQLEMDALIRDLRNVEDAAFLRDGRKG